MTQTIIDNAAAMTFNADVTLATTVSQSRQQKFFRKGPFQATLVVQPNTMRPATYNVIRGAIAKDVAGPYDIQVPEEVIGATRTDETTVNGASQTGSSVDINSTASSNIALAGDFVQFPGVKGTFVITDDVTTDADGDATINLNYPLPSSPTNGGTVNYNTDITFSMFITSAPSASQGPTGLVSFTGPYTFTEDLT